MQKTITVLERSVTFRCTQDDVDVWHGIASEREVSLGELIRETLNAGLKSETPTGKPSEN